MDENVPRRPTRISREESRVAKQREKQFADALKTMSKTAGWHYAGGSIFRQHDDWFVSVMPSLLWGRGAAMMLTAKPMAVDPTFWSIVGLTENERLPLSFRANGAWVLRPPCLDAYVALEEYDPERLAEEVLKWSTNQLIVVSASSIQILISEIEALGPRRNNFVALEICLHLLQNDYESALNLCRDRAPDEWGGFGTGDKTFFDQAREWITTARRAQLRPA